MTEQDVIFEKGAYWVRRAPKGRIGLEVYKTGATASTRCAIIGFEGQKGLDRAKSEIERRIAGEAIRPSPTPEVRRRKKLHLWRARYDIGKIEELRG
jgi:hypothetical protein